MATVYMGGDCIALGLAAAVFGASPNFFQIKSIFPMNGLAGDQVRNLIFPPEIRHNFWEGKPSLPAVLGLKISCRD